MIDLPLGVTPTDEERAVVDRATATAERLRDLAAEADVSDALHPGVVATLRGSGLFEHFVPVEHGGRGLSAFAVALIRERLAHASVAADEFFAAQGIPVQPIALFGTEEQRRVHLPALLDGSRTFAFCMTEDVAGSDVLGIRTVAEPDGAGGHRLRGTKRYVFAGDEADTFVVIAKVGPAEARTGLTAFLLDRPTHGLTGERLPLMGAGPEWQLTFDRCPMPADAVLGEIGDGARIALGNLDRLRPTVGAAAIGMAQRALDETCAHVRAREAFGGHLSDLQGVRFGLADAAAEVEAARSLVYGAARVADTCADRRRVRATSAKAKLFATEAAQRAIDTALQFQGGYGLVRGSVVERLYRAVRATRIYEGSAEIMKLVIARSLLPGG